jgi:hypothetical protein
MQNAWAIWRILVNLDRCHPLLILCATFAAIWIEPITTGHFPSQETGSLAAFVRGRQNSREFLACLQADQIVPSRFHTFVFLYVRISLFPLGWPILRVVLAKGL